MTERAQALASIRRAIYLHEYDPEALMTQIAALSAPVAPAGASEPPSGLARFDLVSVSFAYTSDHEMERADDGEWVRFDDVFPPAPVSPVEPTPEPPTLQRYHVEAFNEAGKRIGGFEVRGKDMGTALAKAACNIEVQLRPDQPRMTVTLLKPLTVER